MDRKNIVGSILKDIPGYKVRVCEKVPEVTFSTLEKNRGMCRTNMCRNYNTCWTCPPNCGSEEFCKERVNSCVSADVVIAEFDNIDVFDVEKVSAISNEFRNNCRKAMVECRKAGFDVFALAGGPCRYCKECSFQKGKECIHPDMQVPSVSGYGVDIENYIKGLGEDFSFRKDRVVLYGLILFKD